MKRRRTAVFIFTAYCALMGFFLFFRVPPEGGLPYGEKVLGRLNPVPFETICRFIRLLGHSNPDFVRMAVVNLLGNVVMFVPLGLLLPEVFPRLRAWWKTMLASAAGIVAVELTQMLTLLGTCDIDDLILNLLGAAIGWLVFRLLEK